MSGYWPQLHWHAPWWLVVALAPWILWKLKQHRDLRRLASFADPQLLPHLLVEPAGTTRRRRTAIALAWSLAAMAAAGPYFLSANKPAEQRGIDLAVIVDISPSMGVADIAPTRLQRVKHELHDLAGQLAADRLGLVVYSANAYVMLPLTPDKEAFVSFVDLLDPELAQIKGSSASRALELATQVLGKDGERGRAALLISDGEIHDPDLLTAAKQLRAHDIPLYTLGVGTSAGGPVPESGGHLMRDNDRVLISRLDTARLTEMAAVTGGTYLALRADKELWPAFITQLRAHVPAKSYYTTVSTPQHIEIFPWLLGASLLLFLWSGLRQYSGLAVVVLLPVLLHPPAADASQWNEQQAYKAYTKGDYADAQRLYDKSDSYTGLMGLGAAAFRAQHWERALAAYTRATQAARDPDEQASAQFNLGNTLARLSRYEEASHAYETALRYKRNFSHAALNLSLVNEFIASGRGERASQDKSAQAAEGVSSSATLPATSSATQAGTDNMTPSTLKEKTQPSSNNTSDGQGVQNSKPAAQRHEQTQKQSKQDNDEGADSAATLDAPFPSRGHFAVQDNSAEFLRRWFSAQDQGRGVELVTDKPW